MKKTVAIIGAGPTGLSLASFLTSYGVKVEVFEKNKTTTPFSKAMVMHARTLEELDDIGIADLFVSQGEFFGKLKVLNISNKKETMNFVQIGKGMSKFSQILSIEQSKTEKIFVKHLEKQGVTIHRSHELSYIKEEKQRSALYFENGKKYEADYVVGCDGARSFIRHFLKFEFGGSTVDETFFVADTHISSPVINKKELYIKFADKNFCLIFPIEVDKKHYRVIGVLPPIYKNKEGVRFNDIQDYLVKTFRLPMIFEKTNRFSTYRVHSRYSHFGRGRYFLAGDAAHIHSPAGGRGMNTGIQDAYNLARKLAAVINGTADERLLDTYDEERYPVAKELIETTDRLFGWMTSNVIFSFLFRNIVIKVMALAINSGLFNKKLFPFLSMLTISYQKSAAIISSKLGRLKAGQRLPYHAALYKKVLGKGFIILSHEIQISNAPCEVLNIKDYENIGKPYFIILRPDKHIAYIGTDRGIVSSYFESLGM